MKNKVFFAVMAIILVLPFSISAQDCCTSLKKNQSEAIIEVAMACNGCKTEIEKELGFQKGVIDVKGDLEKQTVRVVYKSKKNSAENLLAVVQKAGYQAKLGKCCSGAEGGEHKCNGSHGDGHKCSGDHSHGSDAGTNCKSNAGDKSKCCDKKK